MQNLSFLVSLQVNLYPENLTKQDILLQTHNAIHNCKT